MITQQSFMFLSSFEELRSSFNEEILVNLIHLGAHAFEEIGGEVVQTTAFVMRNCNINGNSVYYRLVDSNEKEMDFLRANCRTED